MTHWRETCRLDTLAAVPGGPLNSLAGVRVLDLSDDLAGSYCTKLFADAGAEVLKVSPAPGHPLRHWSRTNSVGRDGDPDGVLFRFLAAGQRSVVADPDEPPDRTESVNSRCERLAVTSASAEQLKARHCVSPISMRSTTSSPAVSHPVRPHRPAQRASAKRLPPTGPLRLVAQPRYPASRAPRVGGGLGEWIAGVYGAAGALAARARTDQTGNGELVDVSTLEAFAITLVCYPSVTASFPGGVRRRTTDRMLPDIERCKDGYVGLTTLTVQQWRDFLAMIDRHDLIEDSRARQHPRRVSLVKRSSPSSSVDRAA